MDLKDIKTLIHLISELKLKEFEYQSSDVKIRIKNFTSSIIHKNQEPLTLLESSVSKTSTHISNLEDNYNSLSSNDKENILPEKKYLSIRSPIIGTFYERPAPDKEVFVKVGDKVEIGQSVCIIEAMKLFNEIESEVSGHIVEILVENASPVEYDQILFLVDPS